MKKIKTTLLFAITSLIVISCDKDYKCECMLTDKTTGKTSTSSNYNINSTKKTDAEKKCNAGDEVSSSYTVECEIK
jgi:hypothetical protein